MSTESKADGSVGLTEEELALFSFIRGFWHGFRALPPLHPADGDEVAFHLFSSSRRRAAGSGRVKTAMMRWPVRGRRPTMVLSSPSFGLAWAPPPGFRTVAPRARSSDSIVFEALAGSTSVFVASRSSWR